MAQQLAELYLEPSCVRAILAALNAVVGKPWAAILPDESFRKQVTDPAWAGLPAPIRAVGRAQLRWDEYFQAMRREVFDTRQPQVALHPQLRAKLAAVPLSLFGGKAPAAPPSAKPPAAPAAPRPPAPPTAAARPAAPAAPAAARPATPPAVARPVAPPRGEGNASVPLSPSGAPAAATPAAARPTAPPAVARPVAPAAPAVAAGAVVGIDLGTTYSVVAHLDAHGRPCSIPNSAGDILTPSVVLFDDAGPVVGKEAVLAAALEPHKVADVVKRDMGAKAYRKKINGEDIPPEVISSLILRSLRADAERRLGPVGRAVITVPAYFDDSRRRATVDAGRLAGLAVLDIINEPTAAAIAYGYQVGFLDGRCQAAGDRPLRVLVFDLGGGTFDVTIVAIQGTSFKAVATDGDVCLGGKDWDERLIEIAADQFRDRYGEDPRVDPVTLQDLWNSAEAAKKTLSERPRASLYVNHQGTRLKVEVTREQFEAATEALLGRTRTTTEIVVRQAGLTWAQIDRVLLVGGSTRMPAVARMLEALSGKKPERSVSADEAVAHGAALYANLLLHQRGGARPESGPAPQFSVTNVNSHGLGVLGLDVQTGRRRNKVLIPKNTPLPCSVSGLFKTHRANQKSVAVVVVEGESERPEACIPLGTCTIRDLPADLPAGSPVQVTYSYGSNGRLHVTARLQGHAAQVTTEFQRENSLDDESLRLWAQFVAGHWVFTVVPP